MKEKENNEITSHGFELVMKIVNCPRYIVSMKILLFTLLSSVIILISQSPHSQFPNHKIAAATEAQTPHTH
ncbi:hypothetical protein RIF29_21978 [Crotalaria pallida]|uniref:Transmembrane protein n=1 Tax=Crotalaria pallida TaxID=3830 RepID=A0AAN9I7N3_CROPI